MPEPIRTEEQQRRARARRMLTRVHPDRIQSNVGAHLVAPLNWIMTRPEVPDNWGQDLNKEYQLGFEITLVGNAPDGTLRAPRKVGMRKPKDFLDILEAYLDTGDIPADLLNTPLYNPMTAPPILGIAADLEDEGDYGDDPDTPRGRATASFEAQAAEHSLKTAVRDASDYDYCVGLRVATRLYAQATMRAHGVLQALDEKVEHFLSEEIKQADTEEKLRQVESRIEEFDFDDDTVRPRLQQALADHIARAGLPEPVYPPPNEFEIRAAQAKTLEELKEAAKAIHIGAFTSMEERNRTLKSVDGYARKIIYEACGRSATIEALRDIYRQTQDFAFTDTEYGFRVLDLIGMHAKYLLLANVWSAKSPAMLDRIRDSVAAFPFRHKEMAHDVLQAVEERKAQWPQLRRTKQV